MSLTTSERLKFRAWHLNLLEMEYDVQVLDRFAEILARPETYAVMQATGLKDKNGKEIFEGDIVKDSAFTWVVRFGELPDDRPFVGFYLEHPERDDFSGPFSSGDQKHLEILGNIYSNPELLKP